MNERHPNEPGNDRAEDRFQELDRAESARESSTQLIAPMQALDRVYGAQAVAVKRRSTEILATLKGLAAAAGEDWYYRFPVKKKGGGQDWIEGPSIKLANDLARTYGNCDVDVRVVQEKDSWVFYARFMDIETGYSLTRPFQQRMSQKAMKTDPGRALDIAFQIGASKAIRNVVCNALQTFADYAFKEARDSLVDKVGRDIEKWRGNTIKGLEQAKFPVATVEKALGRASKDWLAPDIAKVIAVGRAVADGMTTWNEAFGGDAENAGPASAVFNDDDDAETSAQPKDTNGERHTSGGASGSDTPTTTSACKQEAAKPTDDASYRVYALAWVGEAKTEAALKDRWGAERDLRKACNITTDTLEFLSQSRDARKEALLGAKA